MTRKVHKSVLQVINEWCFTSQLLHMFVENQLLLVTGTNVMSDMDELPSYHIVVGILMMLDHYLHTLGVEIGITNQSLKKLRQGKENSGRTDVVKFNIVSYGVVNEEGMACG
ncbi:hypothetical protein L1987_49610 [Smallanthus sonchifolius]|uniref:Uncharacterized protein n=1 Tax=Smallanthus sonchifolius TaxID=185202 RepID=A0ACB9FV72_9ASTR|nr:hypothetical protein L1987_49610 [Smallanthus sonchifolius]